MNANARKWLAALTSGEYKQARGQLRDDIGFCCLGVACDLYIKETGEGRWEHEEFVWLEHYDDEPEPFELTESAELPFPVQRWLGLARDSSSVTFEGFEIAGTWFESLIALNDGRQLTDTLEYKSWTFPEIAEFVESRADELFAEQETT